MGQLPLKDVGESFQSEPSQGFWLVALLQYRSGSIATMATSFFGLVTDGYERLLTEPSCRIM